MKLGRFIGYYHAFGLLVAAIAVGLQHLFKPVDILSPFFWVLFAIVFFLTLVAYVLSDLGIRKGGETAVYSLLGGLFVKLFTCLAAVAVLIVKFPENKLLTALNFFSLYFLFTVFEVTFLLRNLRDQNQT
ncbi:hypothetical protein SAMN05421747_108119 [Parapedobacter composti]|uniref:ATP synthase protein I n=1 Tax=Parapedobacter composti TaxID=623281 RepID=A0A1I1IES5_9SPHI|nr:hypothetical protein [Parapedobacter composti]SFC32203.1 hypothetical protein SAMN05421747_108119 [Parapedobacter composti]